MEVCITKFYEWYLVEVPDYLLYKKHTYLLLYLVVHYTEVEIILLALSLEESLF